jgi:hypothetical protein
VIGIALFFKIAGRASGVAAHDDLSSLCLAASPVADARPAI